MSEYSASALGAAGYNEDRDTIRVGVEGNLRVANKLERVANNIESAGGAARLIWIKGELAADGEGRPCHYGDDGAARCVEGHIKYVLNGDASFIDEWRAYAALLMAAAPALRLSVGSAEIRAAAKNLIERGEIAVQALPRDDAAGDAAAFEARDRLYWGAARVINWINDKEDVDAGDIARWLRRGAETLRRDAERWNELYNQDKTTNRG